MLFHLRISIPPIHLLFLSWYLVVSSATRRQKLSSISVSGSMSGNEVGWGCAGGRPEYIPVMDEVGRTLKTVCAVAIRALCLRSNAWLMVVKEKEGPLS